MRRNFAKTTKELKSSEKGKCCNFIQESLIEMLQRLTNYRRYLEKHYWNMKKVNILL